MSDRVQTWQPFKRQRTARRHVCETVDGLGCGTATDWPEFGWRWRWRPGGGGRTECLCPRCGDREDTKLRPFVLAEMPDACPKCGSGAFKVENGYGRCLMCGRDWYDKARRGKPLLGGVMTPVLASVILALVTLVGAASAQSPTTYISIADNALSTTAEVVCPVRPNRVACVCTNTDNSIGMRYGDSAITTTRGARIAPGGTVSATGSVVYGVAESGTPTIACTDEVR